MKAIIFLIGIAFIVGACSSDGKEENLEWGEYTIQHFNVVIAPDLSNRMDFSIKAKPLEDFQITKIILENLDPKILTSNNRSENQKDIVKLDIINKGLINEYNIQTQNLELNFSEFQNQLERINYIKGRSERKLEKEMKNFIYEYNSIHTAAEKNNFGADIWSYLNGLDESAVPKNPSPIKIKNNTYINEYRHIMILLTDGYIEAGLYGQDGCKNKNQCYYLSSNRINDFRIAFKNSGEKDIEAFFSNNSYGIVPITNPILEKVEILALEINDRSMDKAGNATVFPTDYQIIELFWTDWMKKSGVKKFKMKKAFSTEKEAEREIFDFMGVD